MKKIELFIGLNDKDTKTQKIDTLEAYKIVNNIILVEYDGATIYSCNGIYKHEDGTAVVEQSLKCEIVTQKIDKKKIQRIIDTVKIVLNQESILLQTSNIQSKFM